MLIGGGSVDFPAVKARLALRRCPHRCSSLSRGQVIFIGNGAELQTSLERGIVPYAEAGQTVLIVDDEPTVRFLVTDLLEDLGYTAIEAAESVGGLRVFQSNACVNLL